jgi:flagellar assembly protein FliH
LTSAIIKSGHPSAQAAVRALSSSAPVAVARPSREDEERRAFQARVAALEEGLREREKAIAGLRGELESAFEKGRKAGQAEGLAAANRKETERLALLEKAALAAEAKFAESLVSLERLASLLARDSLDLVLGNSEYRREILTAIVAKEVAKVEKSSLVEIALSAHDFPDKRTLPTFAKKTGAAATLFTTHPDLASGSCLVRLKLGSLDIGLNQQWGAVRARLAEIAEPLA